MSSKLSGVGACDAVLGRRALFGAAIGLAAAALVPAPALAALSGDSRRLDLLRAAFDRLGARLPHRDRALLVDFSQPSAAGRLHLVDLVAGTSRSFQVAHGKGSDPANSGWLQQFSNEPGSNASCRGAFLTGDLYDGQHGRSQRLIGLDPSNDRAFERAIVIHAAWYAEPEVVATQGRLGRSQGCFAVSAASLQTLLPALGAGRLILADRF